MNDLEYQQFLVEKDARHKEHLKLMERDKKKRFDWTHLLDKHDIQGEGRQRFLDTQNRIWKMEDENFSLQLTKRNN